MAIAEIAELEPGWKQTQAGIYYDLGEQSNPDILILGGLGDGRVAMERTVRYLASCGIETAGVIPEFTGHDKPAIDATLRILLPEIIEDINASRQKPTDAPIDVAGISAGGGQAIYSMNLGIRNGVNSYGKLSVVNPVGPANWAFNKKPASTFNKRRKSQTVPLLPGIAAVEESSDSLRRLTFALSQDNCQEMLEEIAGDGHEVLIGFSVYDEIFRPEEGKQGLATLSHDNISIADFPGRHASLSQMAGRLQLRQALSY